MHHKGPLIQYRQLTIQKRKLFNQFTSEVTRRPAMEMDDLLRRKMVVWNYSRLHTPKVGATTESNGSVATLLPLWE